MKRENGVWWVKVNSADVWIAAENTDNIWRLFDNDAVFSEEDFSEICYRIEPPSEALAEPQKVRMCENCKKIWIPPIEECECGCKVFCDTHESNYMYAENLPAEPQWWFITWQAESIDGKIFQNDVICCSPIEHIKNIEHKEREGSGRYNNFIITNTCPITEAEYNKFKGKF